MSPDTHTATPNTPQETAPPPNNAHTRYTRSDAGDRCTDCASEGRTLGVITDRTVHDRWHQRYAQAQAQRAAKTSGAAQPPDAHSNGE